MNLTCRLMKVLASYKSCVCKEMRLFGAAYQFGHIFIHVFKLWRQKTDHMIYMTVSSRAIRIKEALYPKSKISAHNLRVIQEKNRVFGISISLDKALTTKEDNLSLLKVTLIFEVTYLRTSCHCTMTYCDKTEF